MAVVASSTVFGLWHFAPTVVGLRFNGIGVSSPEGLGTIVAGVVVTTTAGLAFIRLRRRSGSLLAPVLAHWATNALGPLAAAMS